MALDLSGIAEKIAAGFLATKQEADEKGQSAPKKSWLEDIAESEMDPKIDEFADFLMRITGGNANGLILFLTHRVTRVFWARLTPDSLRYAGLIDNARNKLLLALRARAEGKVAWTTPFTLMDEKVDISRLSVEMFVWIIYQRQRLMRTKPHLIPAFERLVRSELKASAGGDKKKSSGSKKGSRGGKND